MNRMIRYVIAICLLIGNINATTMHVVIAADTESDIGSGIRADLHLFNLELARIAKYTGLVIDKKIFASSDFDPVLVMEYVRALDVNSDDVVIYYHTSHGFRTSQMYRPWPALDFGIKRSLDFADIVHIIKAKPQRFAIVLADCCNTCIPDWAIPTFYHKNLTPIRSEKNRINNYRSLFLEQRGMVIAAAASPGQYAWIDLYSGGFFTTSFLSKLQEQCAQKSVIQWADVLAQTKSAVHQLCVDCEHIQDTIYEIDLDTR